MSCIVVGCKSHSSRKENDAKIISFHRFPSDVDMRQKWINAIARNNWEWKKQHRICSKHFSDDCFINIGHKWRSTMSTSTRPKEDKVKVQKYDISYIKVGTGDHHVMFLPGIFGTKWTHGGTLIERFNREKFTLVAWDAPGYGYSRPPNKEFSMDFYEKDADVAHELMQVLGISKYSILGFSVGGMNAVIQAAKYREHVNKLVIWSIFSFISQFEVDISIKHSDMNNWSSTQLKPLYEIYGETLFKEYWASWVALTNETYKNGGDICTKYMKDIKCPTLIMYGQKDPLVDVKLHIPHTHKHIKGSRVYIYPEGRHHIHINYADDFYKRVEEFLLNA